MLRLKLNHDFERVHWDFGQFAVVNLNHRYMLVPYIGVIYASFSSPALPTPPPTLSIHIYINRVLFSGLPHSLRYNISNVSCQYIILSNMKEKCLLNVCRQYAADIIGLAERFQIFISQWNLSNLPVYRFPYFVRTPPDSIQRCHFTSIGNRIVEIRRSLDRIISTMAFSLSVSWHPFNEQPPGN